MRIAPARRASDGPRLGRWVECHWLACVNVLASVFVALPLLAPVAMAVGWQVPALWIYRLYHLLCHQWPGRSYFLFGPQPVYGMDALGVLGQASDFLGNPALGWKLAFCERDLAIYGSVALGGLLYACLRRRTRPLAWPLFALCLLPIALDGLTQLFGLRESSWELRTLTGLLAGWAAVWLVYPRIDAALQADAIARSEPAPCGADAARAIQ